MLRVQPVAVGIAPLENIVPTTNTSPATHVGRTGFALVPVVGVPRTDGAIAPGGRVGEVARPSPSPNPMRHPNAVTVAAVVPYNSDAGSC